MTHQSYLCLCRFNSLSSINLKFLVDHSEVDTYWWHTTKKQLVRVFLPEHRDRQVNVGVTFTLSQKSERRLECLLLGSFLGSDTHDSMQVDGSASADYIVDLQTFKHLLDLFHHLLERTVLKVLQLPSVPD